MLTLRCNKVIPVPSLNTAFLAASFLLLFVTNLSYGQLNVQVSDSTTRLFQLTGSNKTIGQNLKLLLQTELKDNAHCVVWADHPAEFIANGIEVTANHCKIRFQNVTLKAPANQRYDYVLSATGNGIHLNGVKVNGNGPAIDLMGKNNGRGEGIRIVGNDCQLTDCAVADAPDGHLANCFYIAGNNSLLLRCSALNPGFACFRCVTNNAIFDHIEAKINRPTKNGRNRLFNLDSNSANKRGSITIRNSTFLAEFIDKDLPPNLREVVLNFDPGDDDEKGLDSLVIENCSILLGASVRSIRNHHVFKIKNITHSRLHNVTVVTPETYKGWAMRLQKTQDDISMSCQVLNCHWDQGINFDSKLQTMLISNCKIGKPTSYSNELFNDINFPVKMIIERSILIHPASLASLRDENENCHLKIRDVHFISEAQKNNSFVFRKGVPLRASFFNAVNFRFEKSIHSKTKYQLWLAYSPESRLALSSYHGLDNTLTFDPKLGVAKRNDDGQIVGTFSSKLLGPPFTEITGQAGDRIFLSDGQDRTKHDWKNADYWNWNPTSNGWIPSNIR